MPNYNSKRKSSLMELHFVEKTEVQLFCRILVPLNLYLAALRIFLLLIEKTRKGLNSGMLHILNHSQYYFFLNTFNAYIMQSFLVRPSRSTQLQNQ